MKSSLCLGVGSIFCRPLHLGDAPGGDAGEDAQERDHPEEDAPAPCQVARRRARCASARFEEALYEQVRVPASGLGGTFIAATLVAGRTPSIRIVKPGWQLARQRSMITLYSTDARQRTQLRSTLDRHDSVFCASAWNPVEIKRAESRCLVACIEWLDNDIAVSQLRSFKARHPQHPVVLVTRWDPENARHLKGLQVDEIVWSGEVGAALLNAVRRTCAPDGRLVRGLVAPLREANHLPHALREALIRACEGERPLTSVKQLALAVTVDRRTLWHQWQRTVGPSTPLRLQDFLHWLVLLRAIERKTPSATWAAVAEQVGVHPHTLSRLARQLAGRTLPGIHGDLEGVRRTFYERALAFVTREEKTLDNLRPH